MLNYQLINICLIPDIESNFAAQFSSEAIQLSETLNQKKSSYYQLSASENEGIFSKPHCTITHVKIPCNGSTTQSWLKIQQNLKLIVGQALKIEITGLAAPVSNQFCMKDIIAGKKNEIPCLAYWLKVKPEEKLVAFQKNIVERIAEVGDSITAQGDDYEPHFTLWANIFNEPTVDPNPQALYKNLDYHRASFLIPCKVVIGNCGPHGQVRDWVDGMDCISKLALIL